MKGLPWRTKILSLNRQVRFNAIDERTRSHYFMGGYTLYKPGSCDPLYLAYFVIHSGLFTNRTSCLAGIEPSEGDARHYDIERLYRKLYDYDFREFLRKEWSACLQKQVCRTFILVTRLSSGFKAPW